MSQARGKPPETAADMWDLVRENQSELVGVKKDVSSLGATVSQLSEKMDTVLEAVTRHSAGRGPNLLQLMGGLGLLLSIVAGLAGGIAVFVGSMYDGKLTGLERDLTAAQTVIALREAEDRSELARLREADRAAVRDRLQALERQAGWAPVTQ